MGGTEAVGAVAVVVAVVVAMVARAVATAVAVGWGLGKEEAAGVLAEAAEAMEKVEHGSGGGASVMGRQNDRGETSAGGGEVDTAGGSQAKAAG